MKGIVSVVTLFALLLTGTLAAQPNSERPQKISVEQIQAAAKSVAAESQTNQPAEDTKAVKRNTTIIVVLLAVAIAGTAIYLIDKNSKDHGGSGIFGARNNQQAVRYNRPFLRQQWQSRTSR